MGSTALVPATGGGSSLPISNLPTLSQMNLIDLMERSIGSAPSFATAAKLACVILRREIPHYNWVGVYMLQNEELNLEAWDGEQATEHVKIPIGNGLCGLAARENRSVVVRDVREDPRYLACFATTRSEIIVPIRNGSGQVLGEIDSDSDQIGAFHGTDLVFLEWLCDRLSRKWQAEKR